MSNNYSLYKIDDADLKEITLNKRGSDAFIIEDNSYLKHRSLLDKLMHAILNESVSTAPIFTFTMNSNFNFFELNNKNGVNRFFVFSAESKQLPNIQLDRAPLKMKFENFEVYYLGNLDQLSTSVEDKKSLWAFIKQELK